MAKMNWTHARQGPNYSVAPPDHLKDQLESENAIQAFLAKGGAITIVPTGKAKLPRFLFNDNGNIRTKHIGTKFHTKKLY